MDVDYSDKNTENAITKISYYLCRHDHKITVFKFEMFSFGITE